MTEIPEHLLARSKARRAALGIGGGDAGEAAAAATPATTGSAEVATVAAAAATPVPVVEKPPPPPPPPHVQRALGRPRIPAFVLPVLWFLPLWAVLYAGTLSPAPRGVSAVAHGADVYDTEGCAGCHGPSGGGGAGPQLSGGKVLETFPNPLDHYKWVAAGSDLADESGGTYGANAKPSRGGMPAFGGNLEPVDIVAVVRHERETLSAESFDPAAWEELFAYLEEQGTPVDAAWLEAFISGGPLPGTGGGGGH